jgi:hypothetical protein
MKRKAESSATPTGKTTVSASGASRKLLIKRLREMEKLSAKEVATIMADAEKIKQAFRLKR